MSQEKSPAASARWHELTEAVENAAGMLLDRGLPLGEALTAFELRYLREAVRRSHGNLSHAAARLGIHRNTLRSKLRRVGELAPPPE